MQWVALGVAGMGALLIWGAWRNARASQDEEAGLENAMIRGTDEPVPRSLPTKALGAMLEHAGGQVGAVLLLFGLLGLFA